MAERAFVSLSRTAQALGAGLAVGVAAYVIAQALVPADASSSTEHDLALAKRLGYVYSIGIVGWTAWLQRSFRIGVTGAVVALAVGTAYALLCESRNFFAIMVAFPCLLGGCMAALLPSVYGGGVRGVLGRFGKGLCAGLVLGFVYMVVLNVTGALVSGSWIFREPGSYRSLMWKTGPVALGVASALFFPMFRWAMSGRSTSCRPTNTAGPGS